MYNSTAHPALQRRKNRQSSLSSTKSCVLYSKEKRALWQVIQHFSLEGTASTIEKQHIDSQNLHSGRRDVL